MSISAFANYYLDYTSCLPTRADFILQAAVSSASSSNSDENVNQSDNPSNVNFFSLTENDDFTPRNSPMKTMDSSTPSSSRTVSVGLHSPSAPNPPSSVSFSSLLNNGISPRTRKLSNSSMASDVSFRLPQFETQPVSCLLNIDTFFTSTCFRFTI